LSTTIKRDGAERERGDDGEHKHAKEEAASDREAAGAAALAKYAVIEDAERDVEVDAGGVAVDGAPAAAAAELAALARGEVVADGGARVLNETGARVVGGVVLVEKLARGLLALGAPEAALLRLLVAGVAGVELVAVRLGAGVRDEAGRLVGVDAGVAGVAPGAAGRGDAGAAGGELGAAAGAGEGGDGALLVALGLAADLVAAPGALLALLRVEVVEARVAVLVGRARARGRDGAGAVGGDRETGVGAGAPGALRVGERGARGAALVLLAGTRAQLGANRTHGVVPVDAGAGGAAPRAVVVAERALPAVVRVRRARRTRAVLPQVRPVAVAH